MMKTNTLESMERWINWPEWAKDAVVVDVDLALGWRDILLLIWRRGRMEVRVKTFTEVVVGGPHGGRIETVTRLWIQRILWPWKPKTLGVVDAQP